MASSTWQGTDRSLCVSEKRLRAIATALAACSAYPRKPAQPIDCSSVRPRSTGSYIYRCGESASPESSTHSRCRSRVTVRRPYSAVGETR